MVLSNDFYNSAGVLRWNLGWASPSYAGAFLATLIPYAWMAERKTRGCGRLPRAAAILIEVFLVFCLCKTQSRAALVALVAAGLFFHLAPGGGRWRELGARAVLLAACIWAAGFAPRIGPHYLTSDLSIHHRLRLWRGSLMVFAVAPAGGCGPASSGRLFRAWFQSPDWPQYYPTPVNSYLFAGIEWGAVGLGAALALLFFAVLVSPLAKGSRGRDRAIADGDPRGWAVAAAGSVIAWLVASGFATLWDEFPLWIVPAGGCLIAAAAAARSRTILPGAAAACLLSLGFILSLKAAGRALLRSEAVVPRFLAPGTTELRVRRGAEAKTASPVWHVWLDADVLGPDPSKELRRWLASDPRSPAHLIVHERGAALRFPPGPGDAVLLLGRNCERLGRSLLGPYARIVVVSPIDPYARTLRLPPGTVLVLPEWDEDGALDGLRRDPLPGVARIYAPEVGHDIRRAWPAIMGRAESTAPESAG